MEAGRAADKIGRGPEENSGLDEVKRETAEGWRNKVIGFGLAILVSFF